MQRLGAVRADQHQVLQVARAAETGVEHRAVDAQDHVFLEHVVGRHAALRKVVARMVGVKQADTVRPETYAQVDALLAERFLAQGRNALNSSGRSFSRTSSQAVATAVVARLIGAGGSPMKIVRPKSP